MAATRTIWHTATAAVQAVLIGATRFHRRYTGSGQPALPTAVNGGTRGNTTLQPVSHVDRERGVHSKQ